MKKSQKNRSQSSQGIKPNKVVPKVRGNRQTRPVNPLGSPTTVCSGSDLLANLSTTSAALSGDILQNVLINPLSLGVKRLGAEALLWKRFEIISLRIEYAPIAPYTTGGQLIGYIDYDPKDDPTIGTGAERLLRAASSYGEKPFQISQSASWTMLDVPRSSPYYVDSDSTSDAQLANAGRLVVLASSALPATTALGNLILHYRIKFLMPQYNVVSPSSSILHAPTGCYERRELTGVGGSGFYYEWKDTNSDHHWPYGCGLSCTAGAINRLNFVLDLNWSSLKAEGFNPGETAFMFTSWFDFNTAPESGPQIVADSSYVTIISTDTQTYPTGGPAVSGYIFVSEQPWERSSIEFHVTTLQQPSPEDRFGWSLTLAPFGSTLRKVLRERTVKREPQKDSKETKSYVVVPPTAPNTPLASSTSSGSTVVAKSSTSALQPVPLTRDTRQGWFSS